MLKCALNLTTVLVRFGHNYRPKPSYGYVRPKPGGKNSARKRGKVIKGRFTYFTYPYCMDHTYREIYAMILHSFTLRFAN